MSFTKGNWVAVGGRVEHTDDAVADICTCDPSDFDQSRLARSDAEIMANARFIAAAPAMFHALKKVCAADTDDKLDLALFTAQTAILDAVFHPLEI
jgi:hypothetical protein